MSEKHATTQSSQLAHSTKLVFSSLVSCPIPILKSQVVYFRQKKVFLWMIAPQLVAAKSFYLSMSFLFFIFFLSYKLIPNISRYLRFWDNVSLHFIGSPLDILKCVKIVCCGYPPVWCSISNLGLFFGKFLLY